MNILNSRFLPCHLAIIMDGNGRWAKLRNKERIRGHLMGTKTVDRVVTYAAKLGINYLTLYIFSSENWDRPKTEVFFLMRLVKRFLAKELTKMMASGIRLRAIGDLERLPKVVLETLHEAISATQHNRGLTLILALSYGGRQDISQALTKAIQFPPSN